MKRFLIPLLAALVLPTEVNANVDPAVNEMCMKAADFKGCVELNTKKSSLPKCNFFRKDKCVGELNWSNGKYVGEISNSKRNGYGTMTWANGSNYVGEWEDGKIHGKGVRTWPSGDKYSGQWKNGEEDGYGTYIWSDGEKYAGEWKNGKRTGKGTYNWSYGEKYSGEWEDGKIHG